MPDPVGLAREIRRCCSERGDGVLKLIVTRGSGGRGYQPPAEPSPRLLCSLHDLPSYPSAWERAGVVTRFCDTRLSSQPRLSGIKHLNRLDQVLASAELDDPQVAEGLMLSQDGRVVCGTRSNLFALVGTRILTPCLRDCGVAGTVRRLMPALAVEHGLEFVEADLRPDDLDRADGLFLTNALIGAWPVRRLVGRDFDISRLPLDLLERVRSMALDSETP